MKKRHLKLTLGFILAHFLSNGHACKRTLEEQNLDNPTKKPRIERIQDSDNQKALTLSTRGIVHGHLGQIEKTVERNINDKLHEDMLKLIFQNPGMVKPTGNICKFWEKLRTDPFLGIQVSFYDKIQFSHFLKSSYPKSHIKFNYNISDNTGDNEGELTNLANINFEIKSLSVIASSLNGSLANPLKIRNLSPLNNFTNLSILKLECLEIGNVVVIDMLTTLKELNLRYSTVKNIPALTNLQALDLFQCKSIDDFSDLNRFIHLRRLDLGVSQFTDVSSISHLTKLQELKLEQCHGVKDIAPLSNLVNLKMLDLSCTKMPVPQNLPDLSALIFKNSPVTDISDFNNLPNLTVLILENSQVKTIPILTNLQVLDLFQCKAIRDFSDLNKFIYLCNLNLGKTRFADVFNICSLENLQELKLEQCNKMTDISPLSSLINLTMLDLTATGISASQTLPHLPRLVTLILQDVKPVDTTILVHNISPKIIEKNNLEKINLQKILVTDIFPINNCPNLRILDISGNWIQRDISGLSRLTNLIELHIKFLCMTLTNADFAPLTNNLPNLKIIDTVDFFR